VIFLSAGKSNMRAAAQLYALLDEASERLGGLQQPAHNASAVELVQNQDDVRRVAQILNEICAAFGGQFHGPNGN
jgi:hypothetical protein